jgi:hypothetical protein
MTVLVEPLRNTMSGIEGLKRVTGKNHGSVITKRRFVTAVNHPVGRFKSKAVGYNNKQASINLISEIACPINVFHALHLPFFKSEIDMFFF